MTLPTNQVVEWLNCGNRVWLPRVDLIDLVFLFVCLFVFFFSRTFETGLHYDIDMDSQ